MEQRLREVIEQIVSSYDVEDPTFEISYPEEKFGDFATNIALKIAQQLNQNPREIAYQLADQIKDKLSEDIISAEVAGAGFINFKLSDQALVNECAQGATASLADKTFVVEFSDPNPFKILHAGHLYTSIVGDAIARLINVCGATVYRVNYGGDVGLHVASSMWAILKNLAGENPNELTKVEAVNRSQWLSRAYVEGTKAYADDENNKIEIRALNKQIYEIVASDDHNSNLAQIYWTTREWSYQAFNELYDQIGVHFDKFYTESKTAPIGLQIVQEQLKNKVFEISEGAVVFRGEKYGLHTRVFVNKEGLPTYEAKELGLPILKKQDFNYDQSIIITANEIEQYMAVVYKALEQFDPELAVNTHHLTHGMVRLEGGTKMSSRKGNILTAYQVLEAARTESRELNDNKDKRVVLAAVKYAFLKQRLGGDIIYDPKESVSIVGNSGVYLQYAYARAKSILAKTGSKEAILTPDFDASERRVVLKLSRYAATLNKAANEFSPHIVCTYLYDLAQEFNRFYENNRVIGDERELIRLALLESYGERLKSGLELLGIEAPERI